jgi:integral membrane sensor domain MASE1
MNGIVSAPETSPSSFRNSSHLEFIYICIFIYFLSIPFFPLHFLNLPLLLFVNVRIKIMIVYISNTRTFIRSRKCKKKILINTP